MKTFQEICPPAVKELLDEHDQDIWYARARIHSRLSTPIGEEANWEYECELNDKPMFLAYYEDELDSFGPVQAISYWSPDQTWRWIWTVDGVHENSWNSLKEFIEAEVPQLIALFRHDEFEIDEPSADKLANLISLYVGGTGAFAIPAQAEEESGGQVFISPQLTYDDESPPGDWEETFWCTFCGRIGSEAASIIELPGGMICDECITQLNEYSKTRTAEADFADEDCMPPCAGCGTRDERIFGGFTSICPDCVPKVVAVMNDKSEAAE